MSAVSAMRKRALFTLAAAFFLSCFWSGCSPHYFRDGREGMRVYLEYGGAKTVYFACSLDRFRLHEAKPEGRDTWVVEVPGGKDFSYFYVIDGRPYVPPCPLTEKDDFGSKNCVYVGRM